MKIRILLLVVISMALCACGNGGPADLQPLNALPLSPDAHPVVIDTDMAADDWLAIVYLLGRADVDVRAITVSGTGEAHCGAGVENALDLTALAGRPEIAVACGPEKPLAGERTFPAEWRSAVDSLFGISLPDNPNPVSGLTAPQLLAQAAEQADGQLQVIALGPLTNVALALQTDPQLADALSGIVIMGGAVDVAGNAPGADAEWNLYVDPLAAEQVLGSGAAVTLVPLDATNTVPMTMDFYRDLQNEHSTSLAEFALRVLAAQEENLRSGNYYFWDPLAAAIAVEGGLGEYEKVNLGVLTEGEASGQTLRGGQGALVDVVVRVDAQDFEEHFLNVLNGRQP